MRTVPRSPARPSRMSLTGLLACLALAGTNPMADGSEMKGDVFGLVGAVSAGGGTSVGDAFALSGWISTGADALMTGGSYALRGGFAPPTLQPERRPSIRASFTASHDVEMVWDVAGTGYVLEFSPSLGPEAVWTPLLPQPTGNSFVTPCGQPARFFRLRKP